MLFVKMICVGKMREKHFSAAFSEYEKRLAAFYRFELEEIPEYRLGDDPSAAEIAAAQGREGSAILASVPKGAYLSAMCIEGKSFDSAGLAAFMNERTFAGDKGLCFAIGGSFGLHETVKKAAKMRLSMSMMTFPHHLARVMLIEQLYRAGAINGGFKYHK